MWPAIGVRARSEVPRVACAMTPGFINYMPNRLALTLILIGGVLHGLQYDPTDGFFIVKKEKNGANSEVLEAKKRDESEDGAASQATSETSLNSDFNQQLQASLAQPSATPQTSI